MHRALALSAAATLTLAAVLALAPSRSADARQPAVPPAADQPVLTMDRADINRLLDGLTSVFRPVGIGAALRSVRLEAQVAGQGQGAKADSAAYWACYAEDAVFFGTAPEERWTIPEFKAYAEPFFKQSKGWDYTPSFRHIFLSPDNSFGWFDEGLRNEKYGDCRGTGVLRKINGVWKIEQYNLSVPIPNELLPKVVEMTREHLKELDRKRKGFTPQR